MTDLDLIERGREALAHLPTFADARVDRYAHGGGRVWRDEDAGLRDLILDLYSPQERRESILTVLELFPDLLAALERVEASNAWSFDVEAYRAHGKPCLAALRVTSVIVGDARWHVHLAEIGDDGSLYDPASGDYIGWDAKDVEAWKPCDIGPPAIDAEVGS